MILIEIQINCNHSRHKPIHYFRHPIYYAVEKANKILWWNEKENDTENMVPVYTLIVQFSLENAFSNLIIREE